MKLYKYIFQKIFIGAIFIRANLFTEFPVDISFVVVDLKYNSLQGIKICEVQQASLSCLNCFKDFPDQEVANYPESIYKLINSIFKKDRINYYFEFQSSEFFKINKSYPFSSYSKISPSNPDDLSSYEGVLYTRIGNIRNLDDFRKTNPGIVVIDAATAPFWIDKKKMSELFTRNSGLSRYKPCWKSYSKVYSKDLAQTICQDIPGKCVVIKPLHSFSGDGVIVLDKTQLDQTLRHILSKSAGLKNHSDPSYCYWYKDCSKSFIIEEFIESDPYISPLFDNLPFDPTLRVVCGLVFDQKQISIHILGMHNKLPEKSLDMDGSMGDLHKSFSKNGIVLPAPIDNVTKERIKEELPYVLTLLYMQMLEVTL